MKANIHILNINRLLKRVKFDISINFIWSNNKELIITSNKVAATYNLNIIEKYIKNLNNINYSNIMSPRFPQSKFYLKVLNISYFIEDINLSISPDIIESVIKSTYIFNNIMLSSRPCIIKVLPKSNMIVIWIDI